MKSEYFEVIKLVLHIILVVITIFVMPYARKYIKENTTKEQRQNALFWTRYVTKIAENLYKQKGSGKDKKEYVISWLNNNGIKLSEEQLNVLIDMVVEEYNKNGWDRI